MLLLVLAAAATATDHDHCESHGEGKKFKAQLDGLTVDVVGSIVTATLTNDVGATVLNANLGLDLPPEIGVVAVDCSSIGSSICFSWGSTARLDVTKSADGVCYDVQWETRRLTSSRDCFNVGADQGSLWYGGAEEFMQHFPLELTNSRAEVAYVPGDMLQDEKKYFGGVVEPWWVSSKGVGIHVPEGVPLFYTWNDADDGRMCFRAKYKAPYVEAGLKLYFNSSLLM